MKEIRETSVEEKRVLRNQYLAFVIAFVLFFPKMFLVLKIFNGSFQYAFIPISIPAYYIAISSIKNRVSVLRPKGKKEPSKGKSAVKIGWFMIVALSVQLAFVLIQPIPSLFWSFDKTNPFRKPYDYLPAYAAGESPTQFYQMDATSSNDFVEIKTYQNIHAWGGYKAVPLVVIDNMLIFIGEISNDDTPSVVADLVNANIETGMINWQTLSAQGFIVADRNLVYVEKAPESFGGATGIQAYDLRSGAEIWQTTFDYKYAIGLNSLVLASDGINIETYHRGDGAFYVLNPNNGEITNFTSEEDSIFAIENKTTYQWSRGNLKASGEYRWQTRFDSPVYNEWDLDAPVLTENLIIVKSGYSNSSPVDAVRKSDGTKVWNYSQLVVSNVAVGGDVIYFLTDETKLLAVETQTGKILGSLQFTPSFAEKYPPTLSQNFDFLNTSIYIAANNDVVAVYFGDTNQVSVFRFPNK